MGRCQHRFWFEDRIPGAMERVHPPMVGARSCIAAQPPSGLRQRRTSNQFMPWARTRPRDFRMMRAMDSRGSDDVATALPKPSSSTSGATTGTMSAGGMNEHDSSEWRSDEGRWWRRIDRSVVPRRVWKLRANKHLVVDANHHLGAIRHRYRTLNISHLIMDSDRIQHCLGG